MTAARSPTAESAYRQEAAGTEREAPLAPSEGAETEISRTPRGIVFRVPISESPQWIRADPVVFSLLISGWN
jgi:hypothetical protein